MALAVTSCHGENDAPADGSDESLDNQILLSDGSAASTSGTMTYSSSTGQWTGTIQISLPSNCDDCTIQVLVEDDSGNFVSAGTATVSSGSATVNASVSQAGMNAELNNDEDWWFVVIMVCDGKRKVLSKQKVHSS